SIVDVVDERWPATVDASGIFLGGWGHLDEPFGIALKSLGVTERGGDGTQAEKRQDGPGIEGKSIARDRPREPQRITEPERGGIERCQQPGDLIADLPSETRRQSRNRQQREFASGPDE